MYKRKFINDMLIHSTVSSLMSHPQEVPSGQPDSDAVGRPLTHLSALKQTTGEAVYVDDIPHMDGNVIHASEFIHNMLIYSYII